MTFLPLVRFRARSLPSAERKGAKKGPLFFTSALYSAPQKKILNNPSQNEKLESSLCCCIGILSRTDASLSISHKMMLGTRTGDVLLLGDSSTVPEVPTPSYPPASATSSPQGSYAVGLVVGYHVSKKHIKETVQI